MNGKMPTLQVVTGDGEIYNFPVSKEKIFIGRGQGNDLVLPDTTVSRQHAAIEKTPQGYVISDLGSYNGTKVNGRLIQNTLLCPNDHIQLGTTKIHFLDDEGPSSPPTDSLVFSSDLDKELASKPVVESHSFTNLGDSRELLVPLEKDFTRTLHDASPEAKRIPESQLSLLTRSNKVLFVLYEISRQLNKIHDLRALLTKIMDLIFVVINADSGFLVLIGSREEDEFLPVVVNHRNGGAGPAKEIKASKTLIRRVIQEKVALLVTNVLEDETLDGAKSLVIQKVRSAICVPLWRKEKIIGVIQLDSTRFDNQFTHEDLELLKAIASQMAMVIEQAALNEQIRQEERLRSRLERFHSPQVIEMILKGDQEIKDNIMDAKEVEATILFSDIVGFTRLAESMPPKEVNVLLNRYFSKMTDIVFKYDGTLDKYIGDGLMAVFGAPMQKEDDAARAILTALDMKAYLQEIRENNGGEKQLDIRIGINTGRVVAGNIGSPKRMDYTVIGDPVNLAARLEALAEPNQILIGEKTYELVKDRFEIREVGEREVKGKSTKIKVYEVLG